MGLPELAELALKLVVGQVLKRAAGQAVGWAAVGCGCPQEAKSPNNSNQTLGWNRTELNWSGGVCSKPCSNKGMRNE